MFSIACLFPNSLSPVSPATPGGGGGGGGRGGREKGLSDKQRKELLAELDERKRKILREVEVCTLLKMGCYCSTTMCYYYDMSVK